MWNSNSSSPLFINCDVWKNKVHIESLNKNPVVLNLEALVSVSGKHYLWIQIAIRLVILFRPFRIQTWNICLFPILSTTLGRINERHHSWMDWVWKYWENLAVTEEPRIQFSAIHESELEIKLSLVIEKSVFSHTAFMIARFVSAIFLLLQWKRRQSHQLRMGREREHGMLKKRGDLK